MRELIPVITVVMVFGIPIVAIIGHYCHAGWKMWLDTSLKREMVARGYTAQEIIAVLGAEKSVSAKVELPNVPPAKPARQAVYNA
jgi:hypothetical protein